MALSLSENTKKYLGYGLIAVGAGAAIYAIVKMRKKKTSDSEAKGKLNGVGRRKKKSTKRKGKFSYKALK